MTHERLLRSLVLVYALAVGVALYTLFPHPLDFFKSKGTPKKSGSLAIVDISGPIRISMTPSAWGAPDAETIARRLHRLSQDDDVKAILLRINSPGGTVAAVQEIYTEIQRCRAKGKKVVASFGDVAASGGYYLGAAADRIVADPGTITGSIGVVMQVGNLEGLFQKVGVKLQVIKTGAYKDIGSVSRPMTEEERRLLQASIDDAYQQFTEAVRLGRRLTPEALAPLADGRIFTGRQAQAVGLVDDLGNLHDAVQIAIKLANLPEKPVILRQDKPSLASFMQQLSSSWAGSSLSAIHEDLSTPAMEYRWR